MNLRRPAASLALALALVSAPWAGAQARLDATKALTQYGLDAWNLDQGLPNATVNAVLQTREGYLWLGTFEGLARFDGVRFTVFNRANTPALRNNGIRALCEDREGGLWIGTNGGGLTRLQDGRFEGFTREQGLTSDIVRALHTDLRDGAVWIGTNGGGLVRYKDGRFEPQPPEQAGRVVVALAQERDGTLWAGTLGEGLRRRSPDGTWQTFGPSDGLPPQLLTAVAARRGGGLWVGTAGGGLVHFEGGRVVPLPAALAPLQDANVAALVEDGDGALWVGTNGGGLARFDGERLSVTKTTEGLPADVVYSLWLDREGSLWVGTNGAGLARLRDGSVTSYTTREGLSRDFAYTVLQDRSGALWAGSAGGLDRLEGGRFQPVATPWQGGMAVRSLAEDAAGGLWIGTYGAGVWRRAPDGSFSGFRARDGLANDNVRAVMVDRRGRVWAATIDGLSVREDGRWRSYRVADGLPANSVIGLAEDAEGRLWAGTDGAGLVRFDGQRFEVFTTEHGLPSNLVLALFVDAEGTLWLGTNGGVAWRQGARFHARGSADGLPSDAITQLRDDNAGNLWLGTSRGISRIAKAELLAAADAPRGRISARTFDRTDGMKSAQCTGPGQPAGFRDRDGRLWFATTQGVVVLDPARLRSDTRPPDVRIEEVVVDGVAHPADALRTPTAPGRVEFRFTALTLLAPSRVAFRFRLEGFDDAWSAPGDRRLVEYTKLPPGDYVFRVSARSGDGPWNDAGAALALTVPPRFYQTRAFLALAGLALVALVVGTHQLRLRALRTRARDLAVQVTERTQSLAEAKERAEAARAEAVRLLGAAEAIGSAIGLEEVLDRILAELGAVVPYDRASVQQLRGDRLEIVGGRGLAARTGPGGSAPISDQRGLDVVRGASALIAAAEPAAEGSRPGCWLGVPLRFGERITGVIVLDHGQPDFYREGHARAAEAFAAHAAIAIEHARLHDIALRELSEREAAESELRRQGAYLASLNETALAVMNRLDVEPLLETLVSRAAALLGAPEGFLYLEAAGSSHLRCRVALGRQPLDLHVQPGEGAVGRVWVTGTAVLVDDYDTWTGRSPQVAPGRLQALLAVPLRFGGRVAGALGLAHDTLSQRRFSPAEAEQLARFAELASIALENARLFAQARQELADRTSAQQAAAKSEERYRDLFEQSLGLICTHDPEGVLLSVNPAAARSLGREAAAMQGHNLREFLPAGALGGFDDYLREIREAGQAEGLLSILDARGAIHAWRYRNVLRTPQDPRPAPGANVGSGAPYVIGFAQDVTEELAAQARLAESEERFRELAENIESVFFLRAPDGAHVLYASPAYERVWGRPRAALLADVGELLTAAHPDDRAALEAALAAADGYELEYRVVPPSGPARWVHVREFPVRGESGELLRFAGIAEDISERKRLERLREDLAHTVVHDLKNPLTAIMGSLEILSATAREQLSDAQRQILRAATGGGNRLLGLVETLLDVSRLEGGAMPVERSAVTLRPLFEEIAELEKPLAERKLLRLLVDVEPANLAVDADRTLLLRILQNLAGNAIKFTPDGGRVRLFALPDPDPGFVRLAVQDSGFGVPLDVRARLFEKFSAGRDARSGTGLGLLFCRLAVEAHGGRIWVEGPPGTGATFCFTLPAARG
ncbi:MAG: PAS domain S-box protein [Vicinamibacteria bacterium]|nr:PAS domain S-box protein [Vicinamibacteria bacterium]